MSSLENHVIQLDKSQDILPSKPDFKLQFKTDTKNEMIDITFEGESIDHSIVNTIKRVLQSNIPAFGFHKSNINIEKNTSIYNNDMMYNIIEQLPIYDVEILGDLINPENFLSNDVLKSLFGMFIQEQISDVQELKNKEINPNDDQVSNKNKKIELYFKIKNDTSEIKRLTTHDGELYINDNLANNYKNRPPILIMKLKPGQEFYAKASASMGIPFMHECWETACNCYFKQDNKNKYILHYESLGQLDVKNLFLKACYIIVKKMTNLKIFLKKNYLKNENVINKNNIEIKLYNENSTLGNPISMSLKKHKDIDAAGMSIPHAVINEVKIMYNVKKNSGRNPIEILIEVIEYLENLYSRMIQLFGEK